MYQSKLKNNYFEFAIQNGGFSSQIKDEKKAVYIKEVHKNEF